MEGQKFKDAQDAAIAQVTEGLPMKSVVSLISFGHFVEVLVSKKMIKSEKDKQKIIKIIEKQRVSGGTPLHETLEKAYELSKSYGSLIPRVILISDGQPTDVTGTNLDAYLTLATKFHEAGISIDAIGVGGDHDVKLMSKLAEWSVGKYVYLKSGQSRALKPAVLELTQSAATQIITRPELEITLSNPDDTIEFAAQYEPTGVGLIVNGSSGRYVVSLRGVEPEKTFRVAVKLKCSNPSYGSPQEGVKIGSVRISSKGKTHFEQDLLIDVVPTGNHYNIQIAKICDRAKQIIDTRDRESTIYDGDEAAERLTKIQGRETRVG
ncbi:MAG: VWA domain-containing protein [Promethearchaeota archaeon]